jgi:hypothetical protein
MDNVSSILEQASRLRSAGQAQKALATIKTLSTLFLTPQEKRAVASEKFDILYSQGYYRKAETVLRKALAVSGKDHLLQSEEECWMHALLRAKMIMTQLHTNGNFERLVEMRNDIVRLFLDSAPKDRKTSPIRVSKL